MQLKEILERKNDIVRKVKELGFSETVKIYNGPKNILYLIVSPNKNGQEAVVENYARCMGLKCELTDLLKCQVGIIDTNQIAVENTHEFSRKSAVIEKEHELQKAFNTDDLEEVEIDAPDAEYEDDIEDLRDTYARFQKENSKNEDGSSLDGGIRKLKIGSSVK